MRDGKHYILNPTTRELISEKDAQIIMSDSTFTLSPDAPRGRGPAPHGRLPHENARVPAPRGHGPFRYMGRVAARAMPFDPEFDRLDQQVNRAITTNNIQALRAVLPAFDSTLDDDGVSYGWYVFIDDANPRNTFELQDGTRGNIWKAVVSYHRLEMYKLLIL